MSAARVLAAVIMTAGVVSTLRGETSAPQVAAGRISLEVGVTRAGQPVAGLTSADFVVRDSGVAQQPELVAAESLPVNLLLALDCSASMRGSALDALKAAALTAFAGLRPTDQGALLTFSQTVNLRASWTNDQARLSTAVESLNAQGSTSLSDAVFATLALRSRAGSRTLIVFVTDGDDMTSWLPASDIVQAARRADAVVSSVMISAPGHTGAILSKAFAAREKAGAEARAQIPPWMAEEPGLYRTALLPILAMETAGESEPIADAARLQTSLADILARHRRRYVLQYTPTGVSATGWHPVQVEVKPGGDVAVRSGYLR